MNPATSPPSAASAAAGADAWQLNPFLHCGPGRIYDPLSDLLLVEGDPGFASLADLLAGQRRLADLTAPERERLAAAGWLLPGGVDPATRFRLRYVSLESHTVCNQACYFCPVSIAPREDHFMPTELYERIVGQLAAFRATIEAVFMINYNEPTLDRRFVDLVRTLREAGLPPAVLTNGTGLTPDRVDALLALGGLRYLSINLSTLDRERYASDRGGDHLPLVLRNLDYLKNLPLAPEMDLVVLGRGDEVHRQDHAEISARFAGTGIRVKPYEVMDRAGYLQIGLKPSRPGRPLRGCDNVGSRPLQHLHITPRAKVVFCCEDYDEYHVVGDLSSQSVTEVLTGEPLAELRRWSYGVKEAPADFMCRKCIYARFAE